MSMWHWIAIVAIVYLVGVKFPGPGQTILSKVGLA